MSEGLNQNPLISVLIPVYNVEKYVRRCLFSLFDNTIINECEIIMVDDCSPDKSVSVIQQVLEEFPHMKKFVTLRSHDCNRGLAAARNTALLQAHGKYIICVDSDDWVEKDYLEKLYKSAEKNNADVVMCNLIKETKDGPVISANPQEYDDCVAGMLSGSLQGWLHEKLIKHSLFMEHNISWVEGLNMCEDLLIMTKVFFYAEKIVKLNEGLYHYDCTNQNSLTYSLSENKVWQLKRVVEEIERFLPEKYSEHLKVQKSRIKIWILKGQKSPSKEDFLLYNSDLLSKCSLNPLSSRFFLWLCERRFLFPARLIIRLKK